MRRREQEWPGAVIQEVDQVASPADVTAECADCLGQRANLDVHPAMLVEMINRAATIAAQYTRGVGVVHHHDGSVFFSKIAQAGQRANVTVHGENAVGNQ